MELLGLNKRFENVGFIDYINLQWNRRYYECGDFSIQIRVQDYDENIKYVYTPERPEIGIVEKLHSEIDITGKYVQISGRFLESLLSRNVVYPAYNAKGKPQTLARNIVRSYATEIPGLIILPIAGGDSDEAVDVSYFGKHLDDVTYPLLQTVERSQRIYYDYAESKLKYTTWQGLDRTQSQNTNNYALFSDVSNNTERIVIDEDESGYRNYALIAMTSGFVVYDGRTSPSEERRYLFIDESKSQKPDNQTQSAYEASLCQKGREELQKWKRINNVEATALQYGLYYLQDYDLGDKVDIVSNDLRRSYEARIIEVREVVKEGQHTVETVFGDKIPSIYERVANK